jgi:hypothetical protein
MIKKYKKLLTVYFLFNATLFCNGTLPAADLSSVPPLNEFTEKLKKAAIDDTIDIANKKFGGNIMEIVYLDPRKELDSGLGLKFDYQKTLAGKDISTNDRGGLIVGDLNFKTNGLIAFDDNRNPADYLSAQLNADLMGIWGGMKKVTSNEFRDEYVAFVSEQIALGKKPSEVDYFGPLRGKYIDDAYVWLTRINAGYESNQAFSDKQSLYGLKLGLYPSPLPGSKVSRFNILDWPFRLTRWLGNSDPLTKDYPRAMPTIIAGVDQIDPSENQSRFAVTGNKDRYERFYTEIAFTTLAAKVREQDILFSFSYRYFKEISPEQSVKDANIDSFRYLLSVISIPADTIFRGSGLGNLTISYSTGRLPFDRQKEQVFQLGWQFVY